MVKQRTFILALAAALLMMLVVGSVAFADGPTAAQNGAKDVCVDGYVINHREQPVDGSQVRLQVWAVPEGATSPVMTADVDKDGYFKFKGLAPGSYDFQLQLPAGWEGIVPQVGEAGLARTGFTQFDASATCYRILFKVRRIVEIPVLKWEERLDGTVTPGSNWLITATPIRDPFARVVTATITNGQTSLRLTPGTWSVAETVKSGWTPITPPVVTRVIDQYQPLGAINPIVFKNREPVCHPSITVTKWGYGTNADGGQEPLGTLAGWKFTVSRADKTMTAITQVTGGDGRAVFNNLRPGVYKVTETVQKGWEVIGDNPVTVVLVDCENVELNFQNQELIGDLRIYGTKWFKAWEKPYKGTLIGLPGWQITATLVGTDDAVTTFTNALGEYEFTEAMLGDLAFPGATLEVCEEERDHWIPTTPVCVTVKFPFPVPADYTGVKVDFTNIQDPPLPGTAATTVTTASGSCSAYHTVVAGDTVAKLAGKYGVSARGIIQANSIKNADVIYRGQRLCIP